MFYYAIVDKEGNIQHLMITLQDFSKSIEQGNLPIVIKPMPDDYSFCEICEEEVINKLTERFILSDIDNIPEITPEELRVQLKVFPTSTIKGRVELREKKAVINPINGDIIEDVDNADMIIKNTEEEYKLIELREMRSKELAKYDKYQMPYLRSSLTTEQIEEYDIWRTAWLNVTETGITPVKPIWFQD